MYEDMSRIDPYFMACNIYKLGLKDKDMRNGIPKVLFFNKMCFNADNVILYKLNENGDYVHVYNSALMDANSSLVTAVLNSAKGILNNQKKYQLNLNFDNIKNIAFIKIDVDNSEYVVALTGQKEFINLDDKFVSVIVDAMSRILDKLEQFEALMKSSDIDTLTGLNNRNAYERDMGEREISAGMIYVIFDLFRLKNVNDDYSHQKGDEYIKKSAEILKRHFPQYVYTIDSTGKKVRSETGSYIYRVGGDEFVLVSDTETYESVKYKIMIIQDEIKNMDLNINEPIGIDCGLFEAKEGDTIRDLYLNSDNILSENKEIHYQQLGLDRRGKTR